MSKKTGKWLIIAASLILVGCIIFGGVMTVLKWDFKKLATEVYETNTYEIEQSFKDISITAKTADINIAPSNDGKVHVTCYEQKNIKHEVEVKDGRLEIKAVDTRKWYQYIGIGFGGDKITVQIPKGDYGALLVKTSTGDVKISADFKFQSIDIKASTGHVSNGASADGDINIAISTGDINIENITADNLSLTVSTGHVTVKKLMCGGQLKVKATTGDVKLSDITCKNVVSSGSTGDLLMEKVVASGEFDLDRGTGDVKLNKCDAGEIYITTDTGDVVGSLLSEKVFFAKADTGKVNVPQTITGGRCEINTDTGDIKITIK